MATNIVNSTAVTTNPSIPINAAEAWQMAYQAFQTVNFSAWDFNTIKQSLTDYLKLYFAEDYNDFIESSEIIMIVELFSYVGELLAYRYDLNAHENFITVANRKESVLRLAQALSYNASRNIPARGLVKLQSIATTETVFDSNGNNLTNKIIYWNDPNNTNWKEQFILVLNKIFVQPFGTVAPSDRIQVQDVLFELYALNNQPLSPPTIPYTITVSSTQYPMELVSSDLDQFGPIESRPQVNLNINMLYLNDGLGDSSDNTGFFFYTKQGSIQRTVTTFDGVTPNQTYTVAINNSNNTDLWVNNIDPTTGTIIQGTNVLATYPQGEWVPVDVTNGQNIIFNTNINMNKYQVQTLDLDQFKLVFGDGQFANIPSGTFEIWSRTSANANLVIPINSIQNVSSTISYYDAQGNSQTFTSTFSLTNTIQNAAATETIDHIRMVAPAVWSTQDRMVTGADYNILMLQDNSILKLQAINRTFAGDSKYIAWNDPTDSYANVTMYGNDLAIYFATTQNLINISNSSLPAVDGGANVARIAALIDNFIQPLLSDPTIVTAQLLAGIAPANVRKAFNANETLAIQSALTVAINSSPALFYITYIPNIDTWEVTTSAPTTNWIVVTAFNNGNFALSYYGNSIIAHSDTMNFYVVNNEASVLNYDTLNNDLDTLVLLQANIGYPVNINTHGILTQNYNFYILSQAPINGGPQSGTPSVKDLYIIPEPNIATGIPSNVTLSYLINPATDFVYFQRTLLGSGGYSAWVFQPPNSENVIAYQNDLAAGTDLWMREVGVANLNYLWLHSTPQYHLVDPAASNIIDTYILTRGFYTNLIAWLAGLTDEEPTEPTPFDLRNDYNYLIGNGMLSDTNVLHATTIKLIIGQRADPSLQAILAVVQSSLSILTANELKTRIVSAVNSFFNIKYWEGGQTFYAPQMTTYVQSKLPTDITAIVLVPTNSGAIFGDMSQVFANINQIIQPSISVNDINIVQSLDPRTLLST